MPRQLYNEGRVVGYSAYEMYVKHSLSVDPNTPPASELEWLSSSIAMGTSMLLRVGTDTKSGPHCREISFPQTTRLCAANTIIGSFFSGEGYLPPNVRDSSSVWSTKVTDYGNLINNTDTSSPTTSSAAIPPKTTDNIENWSPSDCNKLKEYMKIVDGIVIQPGTWSDNENKPPTKDFSPKLSTYPRLRLFFSDKIEAPFFILLTGFTLRSVIQGVSGTDSAVNTASPQDGDFLGPAAYPWANKVIFSVPSSFVNYFLRDNYERKLPYNEQSKGVTTTPIIDMTTTNPDTYYESKHADSRIPIEITHLNTYGEGAAVLTVYQRSEYLPPALYGSKLTLTESDSGRIRLLNPIDTVAPGTLKLYHGEVYSDTIQDTSEVATAKTLESSIPNNAAFVRDSSDYVVHELNKDTGQVIPVAKIFNTSLLGTLTISEMTYPLLQVEGSHAREGVACYDQNDNVIRSNFVDFSRPQDWYIVYNGKKIEGTQVVSDPLPYCSASPIIHKRITGKLSNKIRELCGYEYDSDVFKEDGIWRRATMDMPNQIPESERSNYYYIIPSGWYDGANNIVWPVRKSDNMLDVTIRYGFNIVINGSNWSIPPFYNDTTKGTCSDYLGSWWSGDTINSDGTAAEYYSNKWAYIRINNHSHPTVISRLDKTNSGQVYYPNAVLPADIGGKPYEEYAQSVKMSTIFGYNTLVDAGILPAYRNMSLLGFLRTALYTDMGTGQPLPSTSSNILQPQLIYSNGTTGNDIKYLFSLTVANTKANSGKSQLMEIPENFKDSASDDPLGVITQTGELQALSLSMADNDNKPYILSGTAGNITDLRDNTLHWDDIVNALSHNKSIDILGDCLRNLKISLNNIDDGDYIISVKDGVLTVTKPDDVVFSNSDGSVNYLKFPRGMKLYITNGKSPGTFGSPKKGDIGIGW